MHFSFFYCNFAKAGGAQRVARDGPQHIMSKISNLTYSMYFPIYKIPVILIETYRDFFIYHPNITQFYHPITYTEGLKILKKGENLTFLRRKKLNFLKQTTVCFQMSPSTIRVSFIGITSGI